MDYTFPKNSFIARFDNLKKADRGAGLANWSPLEKDYCRSGETLEESLFTKPFVL